MNKFVEHRPHFIPGLIVAAMLLFALAPWPYVYYTILRWAVCGVSVWLVFLGYDWKHYWACAVFGFVGILFNPLLPLHLTRELWSLIDIAAAISFVVSLFVLVEPVEAEGSKQ